MWLIVLDKTVKYRDTDLNRSREIRLEAAITSPSLELVGDDISDLTVDDVGVDARVKLGDSRSKTVLGIYEPLTL